MGEEGNDYIHMSLKSSFSKNRKVCEKKGRQDALTRRLQRETTALSFFGKIDLGGKRERGVA